MGYDARGGGLIVKADMPGAAASPRGKRKKRSAAKAAFVSVMLAYPVLHFAVTWGYVNFNAIWSSFTRYDIFADGNVFNGFLNYRMLWNRITADESTRTMLLNSFLYFPVTCFVSLPLSVVFSYFLFKKIPGGGAYRVIFYLPSILPIAVLTMSFRFAFGPDGFIDPILKAAGIQPPLWFGSSSLTPRMIFAYCVWAGLGFNIVLLSGAMSRVPKEIAEYGRLEGVGFARELFQIMIPLVWPTVVTSFVLGMSSVLTVYLQPYFLMGSSATAPFGTGTISLYIFNNYSSDIQGPYLAAFGLFCSVCYVPFILLARWFMNRFFKDVDY
ncbi:MAG: sugar ABC transporter permease [Clostridiales bacterium]|nr:sugar ABC transporter permease [Clostridiales bacterium]